MKVYKTQVEQKISQKHVAVARICERAARSPEKMLKRADRNHPSRYVSTV